MTALGALFSRLAALALALAVAGLVVVLLVVPGLRHWAELGHDRQVAEATAGRLAARIASRGELAGRIEAASAGLRASGRHISAETPALAAGAVQRRLDEAAAKNGAMIATVQTLPDEPAEPFVRVALRTEMSASIDAAAGLIYDLESGEPYLFVENLEVQSAAGRASAEDGAPPPLALRLDLVGYMMPAEAGQ